MAVKPNRIAPKATVSAGGVARLLETWFAGASRPLPWRTVPRDPWHCLVAEAMLQQTQVLRVVDYFGRFIARFPTPAALAAAHERDVMALWAGLGYYRRARNLQAAARAIVADHSARVPCDPASLRELPGVGRYTAGSIASIVFGRREPIVDGNVMRVLLRVHGRGVDPAAPATVKWAWKQAGELVEAAAEPGVLNEALMELGATVCTPGASPWCEECPINGHCRARALGKQSRIPRPKTAPDRRALDMVCLIVSDAKGRILVQQRPPTGLWAGLWQPPTLESAVKLPEQAIAQWALGHCAGPVAPVMRLSADLTHRRITLRVVRGRAGACLRRRAAQRWLTPAQLLAKDAPIGMSSLHRRALRAVTDPR